tara:strand:- start:13216 stop:13875 length:660 start_codon:yes stop_codon:yes gene_type:complete
MIKKIFAIIYLTFVGLTFIAQKETIESIYFKNPQPILIESSLSFPKEIRGCYYKDLDSLIEICITEDSIYSSFSLIFNIPKKNLVDNNYTIKDSLVYGIKKKIGTPFKEINDTIYAFLKQSDLFFKITEENTLKISKNKYYLSEFKFGECYNILEVSKEGDTILIKEIDPVLKDFPSNFLNLKKSSSKDFNFHLANPTNENWIDFINNNGFNETTKFHK